MKRTHLFGTMMACTLATAVSLGAQERPSTAQSASEGKTVVVTGCLKSGSSLMTGTSGTAGTAGTTGTAGTAGSTASSSARGGFILTDASLSTGSGGSTASATGTSPTGSTTGTAGTGSTAGTSGTSPSASITSESGKTYSLVGGQQSELQGFLNSKVEIRGTLDQSAHSSGSGTPASGAGSTATGTGSTATGTGSTASGTGASMSGMAHDQQQLRVTSVRQLASSCSGQ